MESTSCPQRTTPFILFDCVYMWRTLPSLSSNSVQWTYGPLRTACWFTDGETFDLTGINIVNFKLLSFFSKTSFFFKKWQKIHWINQTFTFRCDDADWNDFCLYYRVFRGCRSDVRIGGDMKVMFLLSICSSYQASINHNFIEAQHIIQSTAQGIIYRA